MTDIYVGNKTDDLVQLKTIDEQIRDCLEEEARLQSRLAVLQTDYITVKSEIEKKLLGVIEKRKQLQLEKGKGADPWKK
ncbi:MAG: hypothetical protein IKN04_11265 [Clostridia bacterium]|nr:hypothetical protein [Clostridia bacterium]